MRQPLRMFPVHSWRTRQATNPDSAMQKTFMSSSGAASFALLALSFSTVSPAQVALKRPEAAEGAPKSAYGPTLENSRTPPGTAPAGMVWIPGGEFSMGSEDPTGMVCGGHDTMPDARPVHRVYVDGFWMDETEVTNAQFEAFVKATRLTSARPPPGESLKR